jgi:hypothetical protein
LNREDSHSAGATARQVDCDLRARLVAEQRSADRRAGRNRVLQGRSLTVSEQELALDASVEVFDLDPRADPDSTVEALVIGNQLCRCEQLAQARDPRGQDRLLFAYLQQFVVHAGVSEFASLT